MDNVAVARRVLVFVSLYERAVDTFFCNPTKHESLELTVDGFKARGGAQDPDTFVILNVDTGEEYTFFKDMRTETFQELVERIV